jgi:putative DNA primase/helicase
MRLDEIISQFRAAMAEQGIITDDDLEADGKVHRVHVDGDKKLQKNGWYVLHADGKKPAGAFGDNKRFVHQTSFTWASNEKTKPLSPEERKAWREEVKRKAAEKEAARALEYAAAAERARAVWESAAECSEHPYLTRKGVKSHGLRVAKWEKVREETGEIWTDP